MERRLASRSIEARIRCSKWQQRCSRPARHCKPRPPTEPRGCAGGREVLLRRASRSRSSHSGADTLDRRGCRRLAVVLQGRLPPHPHFGVPGRCREVVRRRGRRVVIEHRDGPDDRVVPRAGRIRVQRQGGQCAGTRWRPAPRPRGGGAASESGAAKLCCAQPARTEGNGVSGSRGGARSRHHGGRKDAQRGTVGGRCVASRVTRTQQRLGSRLSALSTYGKTRVLALRPARPERARTSAPIHRRVERTRHRLLAVNEGHLFTPAGRADVVSSPVGSAGPEHAPRQPAPGPRGPQLIAHARRRHHPGTC